MVGLGVGGAGCNGPAPAQPTSCEEDEYEPNDTPETARELPSMQDSPNATQDVLGVSGHTTRDYDWFRVHIDDTGLGGNPVITVTTSATGTGISAWYVCDDDHLSRAECSLGTTETSWGPEDHLEGCRGTALDPAVDQRGTTHLGTGTGLTMTPECSATSSDAGWLYVRVDPPTESTSACSHDVFIHVE